MPEVSQKEPPRPAEKPTPQQVLWRQIATDWESQDPEKGNKIFEEIKKLKRMRTFEDNVPDSEEAKRALTLLLNDPENACVRTALVEDMTANYQAGQWPEVFADIILGRQFLDMSRFPLAPDTFQGLEEEYDKLVAKKRTVIKATTTPQTIPETRGLGRKAKIALATTAASLSALGAYEIYQPPEGKFHKEQAAASAQSGLPEAPLLGEVTWLDIKNPVPSITTEMIKTIESLMPSAIKNTTEGLMWVSQPILEQLRKLQTVPVEFKSELLFSPPAELATPTQESSKIKPTPTPVPTAEPTKTAEQEIDHKNLAEFFLGNLVEQVKQNRLEKAQTDPAFKERIHPELLKSNSLNFLFLGMDMHRGRTKEFNTLGLGRSDAIILVSFDPSTFKTVSISIPRDLFSPEVTEHISSYSTRINEMTTVQAIDPSVNSYTLTRQIVESLTGIPLDAIIKLNIDAAQGYEGTPGIFDTVFPSGLEINIPETIEDADTSGTITFEAGKQRMNGKMLTEYARTRWNTSAGARTKRLGDISHEIEKNIFPRIFGDIVSGNTQAFDTLISALETQKREGNLFFDLNMIEVLKTIRDNLSSLVRTNHGKAILGVLIANTKEDIDSLSTDNTRKFTSFEIGMENGLVENVKPEEKYYNPYLLKIAGSKTITPKTPLGNYLDYWGPIRNFFKLFFQ